VKGDALTNKTLSVRAEDLPLWERAERAARDERTTVSALVASALADKLGTTGVCRVIMYEPGTRTRIEAFEGRWLTDETPKSELDTDYSEYDGHAYDDYRNGTLSPWLTYVAETARGRIAVYVCHYYLSNDHPPLFAVYDDLATARKALAGDQRVSQEMLTCAGYALGRNGKRGEQVVWRDI
jgi:hypothetical protein